MASSGTTSSSAVAAIIILAFASPAFALVADQQVDASTSSSSAFRTSLHDDHDKISSAVDQWQSESIIENVSGNQVSPLAATLAEFSLWQFVMVAAVAAASTEGLW